MSKWAGLNQTFKKSKTSGHHLLESNLKLVLLGYSGCLQHIAGMCVHPFGGRETPPDGTRAVLHSDCCAARIHFVMEESGLIRHKGSGKCLQPRGVFRS